MVLIDAEQHPRFAVGDLPSRTPLLSFQSSPKYDLPELEHLVDAERLAKHVALLASTTSVMSITALARFTMQEKVCNSAPVLGRITGSARIRAYLHNAPLRRPGNQKPVMALRSKRGSSSRHRQGKKFAPAIWSTARDTRVSSPTALACARIQLA